LVNIPVTLYAQVVLVETANNHVHHHYPVHLVADTAVFPFVAADGHSLYHSDIRVLQPHPHTAPVVVAVAVDTVADHSFAVGHDWSNRVLHHCFHPIGIVVVAQSVHSDLRKSPLPLHLLRHHSSSIIASVDPDCDYYCYPLHLHPIGIDLLHSLCVVLHPLNQQLHSQNDHSAAVCVGHCGCNRPLHPRLRTDYGDDSDCFDRGVVDLDPHRCPRPLHSDFPSLLPVHRGLHLLSGIHRSNQNTRPLVPRDDE